VLSGDADMRLRLLLFLTSLLAMLLLPPLATLAGGTPVADTTAHAALSAADHGTTAASASHLH
jgi:hypothetical protein